MYFMLGLLMGMAKVLTDTSYDCIKQQDGYFIRITIIKLNKQLDFPSTSKMKEDDVRDFTNGMDNTIIYTDKVGLEDLITFHDAQFEITEGYHFNEGRNNTINDAIRKLYDVRLKLKKDKKKPARMVIKSLMNSMYGKIIIKPVETDTIVKDSKYDVEECISLKYNYIDSVL